jgi:Ca2+-binding EF-hand superfamily protein
LPIKKFSKLSPPVQKVLINYTGLLKNIHLVRLSLEVGRKRRESSVFRIFDKDEDGKLTVEEFKKIMGSLGERLSGRQVYSYFSDSAFNNNR